MGVKTRSEKETIPSSDRVVFIWGMAITGLAALGGETALIVVCSGLFLMPTHCGVYTRVCLIFTAMTAFFLGPTSLVIAVPIAIALSGEKTIAARGVMALSAISLLGHQFENLPSVSWLVVHPGSVDFIIFPALAITVTFGTRIKWQAILGLFGGVFFSLFLIEAGADRWIDTSTFTSPTFRVLIVLISVTSASFFLQPRPKEKQNWQFLVTGTVIGIITSLALPLQPFSSVVFDESHGKWETVEATFGPNDFGRAVNYTYGLLFKYAEKVAGKASVFKTETDQLPSNDALFVIKMPVQPFSAAFEERLTIWIRGGGRLLVVADHTDLYGTTQILNKFLYPRFGLKINPHAVFDDAGMPTVPTTKPFSSLIGRIDAHGQPVAWQTGTSLERMPLNIVNLATFGPSFSEPADYSHQNRFGSFSPRMSLRYTDHLAVAAFGVDQGAIAIMLDSTPWSNFSIFKAPYRHMFRNILYALERPLGLKVWGWSGIILGLMTVLCIFSRHPIILATGGLALGLSIGSASQVGIISASPQVEGRDFNLRVVSGDTTRLEFLAQLVGPGELNFTRVLSAMAKYGIDPLATTPGREVPNLPDAKRWLFIQPKEHQLPTFERVITHLRRGGDLTVIFAPNQSADTGVLAWLSSLGLYPTKVVALAVSEDPRAGLLNRGGAALLRDIRVVTNALPTSLFREQLSDPLMQSYTIRPTSFPRTAGILNISFSADQFSDDALGDVWEGTKPSSLGRHRESQLASVLSGEDFLPLFPKDLIMPMGIQPDILLPAFALLTDGKTLLRGKFDQTKIKGPYSPSENPVEYLADLQQRAVTFIYEYCPQTGSTTECSKRLLGSDLVEWMVSWAADENDKILAVELLHERRFSGLGGTINVIFGQ